MDEIKATEYVGDSGSVSLAFYFESEYFGGVATIGSQAVAPEIMEAYQ